MMLGGKRLEEIKYREAVGSMLRVTRLHRSVLEKRISELGLHRTQQMLLNYLMRADGASSQKEIAQNFNVTPAAIAMSLKKMEKNGLIERRSSDTDNRVNVITVSKKGKALLEETRMVFTQIDEAMFDGMTEEEYREMRRIFDRMTDNLLRIGAEDDSKFTFCKKENKDEKVD